MSTIETFKNKTFTLRFVNVKADQSKSIQAKKELLPPTLSISDNTLTIIDNAANGDATEYFDIYVNDEDGNFVAGIRLAAKQITYEGTTYNAGAEMGSLDEDGNFTKK
jgi:hypothetical protein